MLTLNLKIDHMKYERCVFSQYNLNQPDICVPLAIQESSLAALPSFVSIGGVNCGGERFYPPVGTSSPLAPTFFAHLGFAPPIVHLTSPLPPTHRPNTSIAALFCSNYFKNAG